MDWKLAKNYTIIFLIILNVILFTINIITSNKYKISNSQKTYITSYLNKNDINIYAEIPSRYYPMQPIKISLVSHDYFTLQDIFFENKENIKRTEEFNNTIFSNDGESLTISSNYIYYKNDNKIEEFNYSKEKALNIVKEYISEIKKSYTEFEFNKIIEKDNYYLVEYYEKYNEYNIFNNYFMLKVYTDGTKEIYFNYLQLENFSNEKIDICSSDEALYVFAREIRKLYPNDTLAIEQIELGYYNQDLEKQDSLTPFYKIYLDGFDEAFYINAYTNAFLNN